VGIVAFAGPQPFTRSKINSGTTEYGTKRKPFVCMVATPWPMPIEIKDWLIAVGAIWTQQ